MLPSPSIAPRCLGPRGCLKRRSCSTSPCEAASSRHRGLFQSNPLGVSRPVSAMLSPALSVWRCDWPPRGGSRGMSARPWSRCCHASRRRMSPSGACACTRRSRAAAGPRARPQERDVAASGDHSCRRSPVGGDCIDWEFAALPRMTRSIMPTLRPLRDENRRGVEVRGDGDRTLRRDCGARQVYGMGQSRAPRLD